MSHFELQKKATEIIKTYLGMNTKAKDIVLLEAINDGTYILFKHINSTITYRYNSTYEEFSIYSDDKMDENIGVAFIK